MTTPQWVALAMGAPVILWLLWTGLRGNPARGRRRCSKCWHSLDGVPQCDSGGWICPECGRHFLSEKTLYRRRRRPARAVTAVLLTFVLCYALTVYPRRDEGWAAFMPTSLAVALYQSLFKRDDVVSRFARDCPLSTQKQSHARLAVSPVTLANGR